MKLVINYDFFNAILDVHEGFTPMKIVRNNKKELAIGIPSFFAMNYLLTRSIFHSVNVLVIQMLAFLAYNYGYRIYYKFDPYKDLSSERLKQLSKDFNDLYIKTDYDLLLKSELISKKYKIQINKESIISLIENKYILVSTYDFNGNQKTTGILQEHEIGSNDYILSIVSPKKELKLVHASV